MSDVDKLGIIQSTDGIAADVRSMILQTREGVAQIVNSGITLLYWRIGKRIQTEVLGHERAEYGKEILQTLSAKLISEFGQGFSQRNLRYMVTFAGIFPESEIVAALSRQLGWSHFKELLPLELLELDRSGIHVAEYLTALPPRELLQQKLHAAIATSRARLAVRQMDDQGGNE